MAELKLRVKVDYIVKIDTDTYVSRWKEHCDEEGTVAEGDDYPPVDEEFAIQCFEEDILNGDEDLSTLLEYAEVEVRCP